VKRSVGKSGWLQTRQAQGNCRTPGDDHVFLNARSKPWTRVGIADRLKGIRRRTGIAKEATPHGLRHLFATAGVARGSSVKLLSAVLGHASTSITEKFYINLDNGHIEALRAIATAAAQRTRKAQERKPHQRQSPDPDSGARRYA
jgi:site-specific recombinase XerD